MSCIKLYFESFKNKILRKCNTLKTPKFHQTLHVVDYIIINSCSMNYDGSRGENFGKLKIKDSAKTANKQTYILNFDISKRISKEDIVDFILIVYYQNEG